MNKYCATLLIIALAPFAGSLIAAYGDDTQATQQASDSTDTQATQQPAADSSPEISLHPEHLNPAFVVPADSLATLINQGQDDFKRQRSLDDILKDYVKNPVGVIGEKGVSRQSYVLMNADGGNDFILASYRAASNYKPYTIPDDLKKDGTFYRTIKFRMKLVSAPRMAGRGRNEHVRADAKEEDVEINNAVLTDDVGDTVYMLSKDAIGSKSGEMTMSGVRSVPQFMTQHTTVNAYGTGGSATATGDSTLTYDTLIPYSEQHPYFESRYLISFPLFDDQGQPLIKDTAKKLTLHLIRPMGEWQVEYDLKPFKA